MSESFPIEILAFDNVPMQIETKKLKEWKKDNESYLLDQTIDGRFYSGKPICVGEPPFQTYILAKRERVYMLEELGFKVADIGSCEEILEEHKRLVKEYGLYGEKKENE